jgi:type 1 glutamine amidotransferase
MRSMRLLILLGAVTILLGLMPSLSICLLAAGPTTEQLSAGQVSDEVQSGATTVPSKRPKLALIVSEFEYKTYETLPVFAKQQFSDDFQIESVINSDENLQELPGIEILKDADVAILSLWRRTLPPAQLDILKKYVAEGKPIVGFRAASHAFVTRDGTTPAGKESWPTFDRDVLGCYYQGHHGNYAKEGFPPTHVWIHPEAKDNVLLSGIETGEFTVPSWLYKVQPLSEGAVPLMMGRVADRQPHEPVAWTYRTKHGGRVFYTSLGSPDDFELPQFRSLLRNAVYWAAGLPAPTTPVN